MLVLVVSGKIRILDCVCVSNGRDKIIYFNIAVIKSCIELVYMIVANCGVGCCGNLCVGGVIFAERIHCVNIEIKSVWKCVKVS